MKTAIVTGAGGLIGPIWCDELKRLGFNIWEIDLPDTDITDRKAVKESINACLAKYGPPRVILHNAGVDISPSPGTKSDLFSHGNHRVMDVNYYGGQNVVEEVFDEMKKIKGIKHIIFIGSVLGSVAADHRNYQPGFDKPCDYGASKRALFSLCQNLATRGGIHNILCNMLSFSMVDGKGIKDDFKSKYLKNVPLGRPLYETDLRRALLGLLIQSYCTGQEFKYFGGYDCY